MTNLFICKSAIEQAVGRTSQFWRHVIRTAGFSGMDVASPDDIQFIMFKICTFKDAVRIGLDLKLNQKYFVSNQTRPKWNGHRIKNWQYASKLFQILIFASKEISRFYEQFFLKENYAVSFLNTHFELDRTLSGQNLGGYNDIIQLNAKDLFRRIRVSKIYDS